MPDEAESIRPETPGFSNKFDWLRSVTAVPGLTVVQFYALLEVFNRSDADGRRAYVSARSVAEKSGKSERRVQGALRELVDARLIRRVTRGGRGGGRNLASEYALGDPREFALSPAVEVDTATSTTGHQRPVVDTPTTGHQRPVDREKDNDDHRTFSTDHRTFTVRPPDAGVGPSDPLPDPYPSDPSAASESLRYVTREADDDVETPLGESDWRRADRGEFEPILTEVSRRQLDDLTPAEQSYALDEFRCAINAPIKFRSVPQRRFSVRWSKYVFDVYVATITAHRADNRHEFADIAATAIVDAARASRIEKVADRILTKLRAGTATKTDFTRMYPSNQHFADGNRGRDLIEPALEYLIAAGLVHADGPRYQVAELIDAEVPNHDR